MTLEWKKSILHHTVGKKQEKKVEKISVQKFYLQFLCCRSLPERPTDDFVQNTCKSMPQCFQILAGKRQILHFFGFFSPLLRTYVKKILEAPANDNEILGNSMIRG